MGMMKRRIPQDIKSYKSQLFFGLSVRQIVCVLCAAVLGIPTGIICVSSGVSTDTTGWIIICIIAPFALAGWWAYNDMPMEVFARKFVDYYFGGRKRKWQFVSTETKIHDAEVLIELEELTEARKQELEEEKRQAKAEKKSKKKKVKANE